MVLFTWRVTSARAAEIIDEITNGYGIVKVKTLYRILRFAALAVFSLALTSCGGGGGGSGSISTGTDTSGGGSVVAADTGIVTLLATDAETDEFKQINLTIIKAELFSDAGKETLFQW